jgi:thiamine-phosphate pyrophosphorylase
MTKHIIKGIYAITPDWQDTQNLLLKTDEILSAGVAVLQYRNKLANNTLKLEQAKRLINLCAHYHVPLIINDDVELCKILNADGIHLGKDDNNIEEVRCSINNDIIVGISCYNSMERVKEMLNKDCDYIAVGACFPTTTKPQAPHASTDFVSMVVDVAEKPVVAIGGITLHNCESVAQTRVNAIAMINTLYSSVDVDKVINNINTILRKYEK